MILDLIKNILYCQGAKSKLSISFVLNLQRSGDSPFFVVKIFNYYSLHMLLFHQNYCYRHPFVVCYSQLWHFLRIEVCISVCYTYICNTYNSDVQHKLHYNLSHLIVGKESVRYYFLGLENNLVVINRKIGRKYAKIYVCKSMISKLIRDIFVHFVCEPVKIYRTAWGRIRILTRT